MILAILLIAVVREILHDSFSILKPAQYQYHLSLHY